VRGGICGAKVQESSAQRARITATGCRRDVVATEVFKLVAASTPETRSWRLGTGQDRQGCPARRGRGFRLHCCRTADGDPVATPKALLADKGYESDRFRESLLVRGILPIIPPRSNRKVPEHPD